MNVRYLDFEFRRMFPEIIPKTTYLTHGIHQYTAKIIPHIPRYFLEKYTRKNEIILDPFCGSGTTILEARLLCRNAIGIDINPLAPLISEVKATQVDVRELNFAVSFLRKELRNDAGRTFVQFPNIDYWFCEEAQNELSKIKFCLEHLRDQVEENIYRFLLVCFSSIIRKSSYADSRMAKTYKSKRVRERIENGWVPTPIQYFEEALDKNFNSAKLLSRIPNLNDNYVKAIQGDARETATLLKQEGIDEVDFVITSPPYISAQDYFRSYKLEIWWLGLATYKEVMSLYKKAIGTERISRRNYKSVPETEDKLLNQILYRIWEIDVKKAHIICDYFENMAVALEEIHEILKRDKNFCLVTGNNTICGIQIPTYEILNNLAQNIGFDVVTIGRDKIENRLLPPNRNHSGGIIKEEWITVFRKR